MKDSLTKRLYEAFNLTEPDEEIDKLSDAEKEELLKREHEWYIWLVCKGYLSEQDSIAYDNIINHDEAYKTWLRCGLDSEQLLTQINLYTGTLQLSVGCRKRIMAISKVDAYLSKINISNECGTKVISKIKKG